MIEYIKKNWLKIFQYVVIFIMVIVLCYQIYNIFRIEQIKLESKLQQAIELTQQQTENVNVLQNELKISKQNAALLADAVKKAQSNQVQPNTYITVQSPSVEQATAEVKDRIDKKDTTLPPVALENTDRTVVTPQPENENYQVGVYKINTYRNWYVGAGVGVHDNDWYVPVSLQRNFTKDKAVELQLHVDVREEKINGGQILYKRAMDRLFYFF